VNVRQPVVKYSRGRQQGAALIAAIFVITALAALGGLMTQFLVLGSKETIDEWYSSQALYAAESGVEWAVWSLTVNGGSGVANNSTVITNRAWVSTTVASQMLSGGRNLYTVTSTGTAGGSVNKPRAQRQIVVQFM
jgi:type II secretory pathway component PulK